MTIHHQQQIVPGDSMMNTAPPEPSHCDRLLRSMGWLVRGALVLHCAIGVGAVRAQEAVTPERRYAVLLASYRSGTQDVTTIVALVHAARAADKPEVAASVATEYIHGATDRELLTKEALGLVAAYTRRSSDRGFGLFRQHAARIDQVMGRDGYAQRLVDALITKEEIASRVRSSEPLPDWDAIASTIARKYDAVTAARIVAAAKARRWEELQQLYPAKLDAFGLNNRAWRLFESTDDREQLEAAAEWMKRVLTQQDQEGAPDGTSIDTYANLLYKLGRVEEAIAWEERAIAVATAQSDPVAAQLREYLDKMKRREPTWPQR